MKNRKLKFLLITEVFSILLFYSTILCGDRTISINLNQVNSQQLDPNKVNYLTNKGGYFKKMAVTNSALAREAIKRGVVRFSNGTPKDLDTDQSYNEQLTYRNNRTRDYSSEVLNAEGNGYVANTQTYDESGHLISDGESDRISSANTLGVSGNASQANIIAAETLYLKKEAAYNALVAAYNAALAAEVEAFPEWDTAQKLKDAKNAEYNLAVALDDLNTDRDELQDALDNISYLDFDEQDEITSTVASNYEETTRLGLVNAYALAAAEAVEEWNDARAVEETARLAKVAAYALDAKEAYEDYDTAAQTEEAANLKNQAAIKLAAKEAADEAVTNLETDYDTAKGAFEALDLNDTSIGTAQTIVNNPEDYSEAEQSAAQAYVTANSAKENSDEANDDYTEAKSSYAGNLGIETSAVNEDDLRNNKDSIASTYSTAAETADEKQEAMEDAIRTYNSNNNYYESDISLSGTNSGDVYNTTVSNYNGDLGEADLLTYIEDAAAVASDHTAAAEITSTKNTAKDSAVRNYNDNNSSSETEMSYSSTTDAANNIFNSVNSNYQDTEYYDKVSGITDVSTLASNYSAAQDLTQKTSDRDSSQSTYDGDKSTYNSLVEAYNATYDEHSASIPDSYTPLTEVVTEDDVTATEAAEAAKNEANSNYSTLDSAYQPLLAEKQVEESSYSFAEEEMNTAWAMVEEARGN